MRLQEPFDEEHDKVVVGCWDVFAGHADAGPLSSQAAAADVSQSGERERAAGLAEAAALLLAFVAAIFISRSLNSMLRLFPRFLLRLRPRKMPHACRFDSETHGTNHARSQQGAFQESPRSNHQVSFYISCQELQECVFLLRLLYLVARTLQ